MVAEALGCEAVVTVGSGAEAIPHSSHPTGHREHSQRRPCPAAGPGRAELSGHHRCGRRAQAELEARDIPSVSLRAGIPHYLMNAEHPQATSALVRHLSHVLDVPNTTDFSDQVDNWRDVHDEIANNDEQLKMYVQLLEAEFDRRAEAQIPTADDLGSRVRGLPPRPTPRRTLTGNDRLPRPDRHPPQPRRRHPGARRTAGP